MHVRGRRQDESQEKTYHTEDLPLLVNLPIVEADDSFDILELLKEIDLALVASYCRLIGIF